MWDVPQGMGLKLGVSSCCTWGAALVPSTCPQHSLLICGPVGPRNLTHTLKRFCSFPVFFPQPAWCPSLGSGPGPAAAHDAMFLQGEQQGQESPAHRMSATPPSGHDASSSKSSSRTKRLSLYLPLNPCVVLSQNATWQSFCERQLRGRF